jgi:glycosyltransferase involved in cell wall biosynthesis
MANPDLPRTIFVGNGKSGVAWYRCALPAMYLDVDWVGAAGAPGDLRFVTGLTEHQLAPADLLDYDVVVLQQPSTPAWCELIGKLQAAGVTVLFEIDDYIQVIHKLPDHPQARHFGPEVVHWYEECMRAADGVICSTEWLAERYRRFNPRVWVCRNGLDLGRYDLTRPRRPGVAIGWAGGAGHLHGALPWLKEVAVVMEERPETRFVSVGTQYANSFSERFGPARGLSVGWAPLDSYPASMTMFDIAIAPAGKTHFFRGKSDLRWLEASALSIPVVADARVYTDIEHGVTGFHAHTAAEVRDTLRMLVDDADLRERVGADARAHVREHRDMRVMAGQWAATLREAVGDRVAQAA